jgi:dTDP-4-amino-4,6-dideoxygalactose transaminase
MSRQPIYVTKPFLPPIEEFYVELQKIWETKILTNNGPMYETLEEKLKKYLQAENISLFVNGHQALEIAIQSLELKGEVITTPFSFASTTHAIVRCGLTPVFSDIRYSDFNLDESLIESMITEKTSAILPVHVYGNPCNIEVIEQIARKYNLKVIYDAAHAFGVEIEDRSVSNFGDISMFSFHATKVFNTIEGGALTFKAADIVGKVRLLKNFGIKNAEEIICPGTNAKMNEFQALMGLLNLKYVDQEILNRKKNVEKYRMLLSDIKGIHFFNDLQRVRSNYAYFPILVEDSYGLSRNQLYEVLANHNIFARKYFFPLISNYPCYKEMNRGTLTVANYVADRILTLPLWGDLSNSIIEEICMIISNKN